MKQLLNTLYITTPESYLSKDGTNLVISVDNTEKGRIPIHNIQQVICFGYSGASPGAMYLCASNNVTLTFLTANGRYLASVSGETKGNVLLRRTQYRFADDPDKSLEISKNTIMGKLINCRSLLKKGLNNHSDKINAEAVKIGIDRLTSSIGALNSVSSSGELRGLEGDAAKNYFKALDELILKDKRHFYMKERSRRPPKDRFNTLLSFLYSMLANDVQSALESVGLDPYVGFFHTDRPGRPSLALDIMEELRPLADRTALRLVNLGIIDADGFIEEGGGSYLLTDDARAAIIQAWHDVRYKDTYHPYIKETVQSGMIPFVQASLLVRYLRGDVGGYPPYVMKSVKQ